MRENTQSGKVVSSHSSACGASSLTAKLVIDSRSASCSSVKMKCLRSLSAADGETEGTGRLGSPTFVQLPRRESCGQRSSRRVHNGPGHAIALKGRSGDVDRHREAHKHRGMSVRTDVGALMPLQRRSMRKELE